MGLEALGEGPDPGESGGTYPTWGMCPSGTSTFQTFLHIHRRDRPYPRHDPYQSSTLSRGEVVGLEALADVLPPSRNRNQQPVTKTESLRSHAAGSRGTHTEPLILDPDNVTVTEMPDLLDPLRRPVVLTRRATHGPFIIIGKSTDHWRRGTAVLSYAQPHSGTAILRKPPQRRR